MIDYYCCVFIPCILFGCKTEVMLNSDRLDERVGERRDTFYATIESVRCYLSLKGKISFSFFDIIKGNSACTGDVKTLLSLCCDNLVISDSRVLKLVNKRKLHDLLSMSISGWCTIILTLQTVNFVSKIRLGQVKI